jgi:threonine/homoserine/homoserine lactone efflux protein
MWAKGNRANRTWIYVLTVCVVFFCCMTIGMVWFVLYEGYGRGYAIRTALGCLFLVYIGWNALRNRRKRS